MTNASPFLGTTPVLEDSPEPGGFYGVYRGVVTNTNDPAGMSRIKVIVPQLFGNTSTETDWALPCLPEGYLLFPNPGQGVWITFEGGDLNYPVYLGIWQGGTPIGSSGTLFPIQNAAGTAVETVAYDNNGNPEFTFYIYGAGLPVSGYVVGVGGLYPIYGTQTYLGTAPNPWPVAFISSFGQLPQCPDGSLDASQAWVAAFVANALAGVGGVPSAPTITGATGGNTNVALTWTAPTQGSPFTAVQVYQNTVNNFGTATLIYTDATGSALAYTAPSLTNGNAYVFWVVYSNQYGVGPPSAADVGYPTAPASNPSAPTMVSAVPGDSEVTVNWTYGNPGSGTYDNNGQVWRAPVVGGVVGTYTDIDNTIPSSSTSYTDDTAVNGSPYSFYFKSHTNVGYSPEPANPLQATPQSSGSSITPPAGFNTWFSDSFGGTSLNQSDTNGWFPGLGLYTSPVANGVSYPPNTGNTPQSSGKSSYYNTGQVVVNNGLTLKGQYSSAFSSTNFNMEGSCVTSRFTLPHTGYTSYYIAASCIFPDCTAGNWSAFWLAWYPTNSNQEIDIVETGWAPSQGGNANGNTNIHQAILDGIDYDQVNKMPGNELITGPTYHTYEVTVTPGVSIIFSVDGNVTGSVHTSSVVMNPYSIILWNGWAANIAGYHTQGPGTGSAAWQKGAPATGYSSTMNVAEVLVALK